MTWRNDVGTLGDQYTHFTRMLGQRVQHFSEDTKMKDCHGLGNRTCGKKVAWYKLKDEGGIGACGGFGAAD